MDTKEMCAEDHFLDFYTGEKCRRKCKY